VSVRLDVDTANGPVGIVVGAGRATVVVVGATIVVVLACVVDVDVDVAARWVAGLSEPHATSVQLNATTMAVRRRSDCDCVEHGLSQTLPAPEQIREGNTELVLYEWIAVGRSRTLAVGRIIPGGGLACFAAGGCRE
jgi:hypothetical protein